MKKYPVLLTLWLVMLLAACSSRSTTGNPVKTAIPTRLIATRTAPLPVTYQVTTRAGQELQFDWIRLEPNEYVAFHTETLPQGIPLKNGVEVSYDFIQQVEFGTPSAGWQSGQGDWPVSLILTDGSVFNTSLGFKAQHQIHLVGQSNYGFQNIDLTDIQKIVMQRTTAAKAIPRLPEGKDAIMVQTIQGEFILVTNPKIFGICMYEVYCCHEETLTSLPLKGVPDVPFQDMWSARFSSGGQISIHLRDGREVEAKLRDVKDCLGTAWRLRGKAALGDYEIMLSDLTSITNQ